MKDGLRVIRDGLHDGDLIVVNGLQRVRPGVVVTPVRVGMAGDRPPLGPQHHPPSSRKQGDSGKIRMCPA